MGPILGGFARFKFTATNANVVVTGHSISVGVGAGLAALAPISNQFTIDNLGVNGARIADLRSAGATHDAHFVSGKKNILLVWGATNTIWDGATGQAAFDQMKLYCQERRAAKDWKILIYTEIPRIENQAQGVVDLKNQAINDYNALVLAKFREMGAVGFIDLRQSGSPYNLPDYTLTSFDASGLYQNQGTNYRVHLVTAGYAASNQYAAAALARLPR